MYVEMSTDLEDPVKKDLFVIHEDSHYDFQTEDTGNFTSSDSKNVGSSNLNLEFEQLVKSNAFRKGLKKNNRSNKPNLSDDKEICFLNKQADLISYNEKSNEIEKILEEQRYTTTNVYLKQKYDDVKEKLNKNRNPNVTNLIKDIRAQSSLSDLQNNLKQEFSRFINRSVNESVETVKQYSSLDNSNKEGIFLTQEADEEVSNIFKKDESEKKSLEMKLPLNETNTEKKTDTKTDLNSELKNSNKINHSPDKMQVALVDQDNNNETDTKNNSLIKLKKMLDSIKRIDLPKFQSEIHQVCQYGSDPQLLKFVSQHVERDLSNKKNGLGRYCIHECCIKGNVKMLKSLLPYVQDINCLDQNEQNAAHIAAKFGELECLKLLTANGIDLQAKDNCGMLPCHLAAAYNHSNIIDFLFEMGLPLNKKCSKGRLPFHYASESGSYEALKSMGDYFVDFSVPDDEGNTAGHLAAKNDKLNCLKYLIQLGLPVNKVKNNLGRNVIHMCCYYGSVRCLHWLFENVEIDYDAVDEFGNTLSHSCCLGGRAECLNCCIQHDVKLDVLNYNGESPIELARKIGKSIHVEKGIKNQITCEDCVKNALRIKFEKENEKTVAERTIEKNKDKMYNINKEKAAIRAKSSRLFSREESTKSSESGKLSQMSRKRDLIAQYFGPDF